MPNIQFVLLFIFMETSAEKPASQRYVAAKELDFLLHFETCEGMFVAKNTKIFLDFYPENRVSTFLLFVDQ